MAKIMNRLIARWWWTISLALLLGFFIFGYKQMYFHQDDIDWFIMANRPFWGVIVAPIADHVNYLWRVLLKAQWNAFGLYFPGYLTVSFLMHAGVIWLIYKLSLLTSGRRDLAGIAAIIYTINTNWTEVVLWISGQTISITVLFVLLAMISIWNKRGEVTSLFLAGMTSALALGLPIAAMLVYGYKSSKKHLLSSIKITKVGWGAILSLLSVIGVYFFLSTDGTKIEFGRQWLFQVIQVWGLAIINTVIGRLIVPFDRFEMFRIIFVLFLMVCGAIKWKRQLYELWKDEWSRFLILQMGFYYLIVAAGRSQYGVGMMRAERYGYLGVALFLLLVIRALRNVKLGRWILLVPVIVLVQCFGLYQRSRAYVQRPQQLKLLIQTIQTDRSRVDPEAFLPDFVFGYERLKYFDLMSLIKD